MAFQVLQRSALSADEVLRSLARSVPPQPQRSRLDRITGGFDVDDAVAVQGDVYASGHVQVRIRRGFGRQDGARPVLTGTVVPADGGSRFTGALTVDDPGVAGAAAAITVGAIVLLAGLVAEIGSLVRGGSATSFLPIPIFGAVFVAFGVAILKLAAPASRRRDGPLLLAWLDAGCASDNRAADGEQLPD